MVRFSGLVTAGDGKFEESRAQAVTAKHIGFVGEFPTHTSTQKRNGCAKKAYLGTGDRTTLTSTGPLHPSDFALRLKAPQQSAHLRRVEQYCSARQSYLSSCLVPTCSSPLWSFIFCSFGLSSLLPPSTCLTSHSPFSTPFCPFGIKSVLKTIVPFRFNVPSELRMVLKT